MGEKELEQPAPMSNFRQRPPQHHLPKGFSANNQRLNTIQLSGRNYGDR